MVAEVITDTDQVVNRMKEVTIIIINTDLQHIHVYNYAGEYWGL